MKFDKCFKLLICILLIVALMPIGALQIQAADVNLSKIVWLDEKYDRVQFFSDDFIKVGIGKKHEEKWGLIDKNGKEIIAPQYDYLSKDEGNLIHVGKRDENKKGQFGYIDMTGKVVIPIKYSRIKFFHEGLAAASIREGKEEKWGFIDQNGKTVIPFKYSDAGQFKNGIANVALGKGKDMKWFYIDKNANITMSVKYAKVSAFDENGFAKVAVKAVDGSDYLYGLMDRSGKEILAPKYSYIHAFKDAMAVVSTKKGENTKYGYIDKSTKEVIELKYDDAQTFFDGWAAVALKENDKKKWSYIDTKGKEMLKVDYHDVGGFHNGLAKVCVKDGKDEKWGYIDKSGKEVVKCQFDEIGPKVSDERLVKINGKWGKLALSELYGQNLTENGKKSSKQNIQKPPVEEPQKSQMTSAKGEIKAKYSVVKLSIDSVTAEGMEIYNIEDSNYFKLRDVAKLLDSTQKKFSVSWNNEKKMISLKTDESYQALGTELSGGDKKDKIAVLSDAKLELNGEAKSLKAYTINGNNYFKLRDLAEILGVKVDWDGATGTILLKTK